MTKKLMPYLKGQKKDIWLSVLCSSGESLVSLLIPLVMAAIMDNGIANGDLPYTIRNGVLMTVMALVVVLIGVLSVKYSTRAGMGLGADLRSDAYHKLQTFTFRDIESFGTASIITRLTTDVATIQSTAVNCIKMLVRAPTMLLFSVILSFILCPKLALMFLAIIPLVVGGILVVLIKLRPYYQNMQLSIDQLNLTTQENLVAMALVKAFVRKNQQVQRFEKDNDTVLAASDKAMGLSILTTPIGNVVLYAATIGLFWLGGHYVMGGEITIGQLTSLSTYLAEILSRILQIANCSISISRSAVSFKRITEIIDTQPDITDGPGGTLPADGSINFDHVSFRYGKTGQLLLEDLDLSIPSGQTVSILGATGSAKSTLVSLIPRLYDICGGQLTVGGADVKACKLKDLRDSVSIVLQKNTLFSGTIRENLMWGKPDATQEELDHACRAACALEFISKLPQGYDTKLGQGGVNLSGGQRQRLCIARAILKAPKILILDDSTSAVDMATDAAIRKSFVTELPGVTKLIIAQRVASAATADRILIMQDGKIVGDGSHSQLLESCDIYRELCQLQHYGEEEYANA